MRKLLLAFVALFVAMSAHAIDYYLIGGFNNWGLAQANCKFTAQSDGTYVLDYNGTLTSGFKINDGTWSNDAANFGGSATLKIGETYNLTSGGSSGNIPLSENITNPHLVLNPSAKTLLITGQASAVEYVYGIHSSWFDSNWSTSNMTEENGKWVLANVTVPAGQFGIKQMDKSTGSQTAWISADGNSVVVLDTPMPCKEEGTNFSNAAGTYTLTFDPNAMTLTVTGTQTGDTPVVGGYDNWWVNVMGSFAGGDNVDTAPSAQPNAEGIASFSGLMLGTATIEIKTWDGQSDAYYSYGSTPIPLNQWVQLGDAMAVQSTIEGAEEGAAYDIQFNVSNNEIFITKIGGGSDTPGTIENVYVIGSFPNNAWNIENPVTMTNEGDGIFSIKDLEIENGSDGATMGYFAFTTVKGSWDYVNANRFGPAVKDTEAVVGENAVDGTGDTSWSIVAGTYDMTFDVNEKVLTIQKVGDVPDVPDQPGDMKDWYVNVFGPFNNWTDNGVQPVDGISTTNNLAINAEGFKVKVWNGAKDIYYISDSENAIPTGEWVQLYEDTMDGPTVKIQGAGENTEYTVMFNCETNQVYVKNTNGDDPDPDVPDTPKGDYIYVVGDGEGLGWDLPGLEVAVNAEGNFVFSSNNLVKFKFSTVKAAAGDWDAFNEGAYSTAYNSFSNAVYSENGETLPIEPWGEDQMLPYQGDYTITINQACTQMTAKTTTAPSKEAPAVYIRGGMNDWGTPDAWKFNYVEADDEYQLNCKISSGVEFKIADSTWGNINYGLDYAPSLDGSENYLVFNSGTNIALDADFSGLVIFKITGNQQAYVIFKGEGSDVDSIEAADADAVYFNLQGVKVANPDKGIYIKVVDGKATKVVL